MKTLLVLRHAKSSWKDSSLGDHERPLNKRGLLDAPRMGERIGEADLCPNLVVSSTAVRARHTAELVAESCGYGGSIVLSHELYHGAPVAYLEAAQVASADVGTLLLVGHNPGVQDLVRMLSGHEERMPTTALAHFESEIDAWDDLGVSPARLVGVWRPKEIF